MGSSNRPAHGPKIPPIDSQQVPGAAGLRQISELTPHAKPGRGAINEGIHPNTQKEPDYTRNSGEHEPSSNTAAEPTAFEYVRSTKTQKPTSAVGSPTVTRNAWKKGVPGRKVEVVYHEEEELEFLDFYGEKSHGEVMLRSKCSD